MRLPAISMAVLAACTAPSSTGGEGEGEGGGEGEGEAPALIAEPSACLLRLVDDVFSCGVDVENVGAVDVELAGVDVVGGAVATLAARVVPAGGSVALTVQHEGAATDGVAVVRVVGGLAVAVPIVMDAPRCAIRLAAQNGAPLLDTVPFVQELDDLTVSVVSAPSVEGGAVVATDIFVSTASSPTAPLGGEGDTRRFVPPAPGRYSLVAHVLDDRGVEGRCALDVDVAPLTHVVVQVVAGAAPSVHVARDGAFCSIDDCWSGGCAFGVYASDEQRVTLEFPVLGEGRYTVAAEGEGLLVLRVFVRVAFAGEFVSTGAFTAADLIVDPAGAVAVVDPSTTFDGCPAR